MKVWYPIILPSIVLLVLIMIDTHLLSFQYRHQYWWIFLIFFVFLGYISKQILEYSQKDSQTKFSMYYFSTMIIRLLLSVLLIFVLLFKEKDSKVALVLNFFAIYLLYFVFEIYYLLANLQANSKK